MEYKKLNNDIEIPILGFGTYQIPKSKTKQLVKEALKLGYRSIDTAQCYFNEREVGEACKESGVPRKELFITTKLWGVYNYNDTLNSIEDSLRELDLEYIDLLLLHEPTGNINEIYRAMEKSYKDGKVRAIGVSNFLENNFNNLINNAEIIPAVNQVETHIFRQQDSLRELEKKLGTAHESWSPLACGRNNIFNNEILKELSKKYNKTPAQIALRFLTQQNIIVIPKTMHKERMKENLDSLSFDLDKEDIEKLKALNVGKSFFNWW